MALAQAENKFSTLLTSELGRIHTFFESKTGEDILRYLCVCVYI
jgi:hypothetical protein